jgi:hypothetical protein
VLSSTSVVRSEGAGRLVDAGKAPGFAIAGFAFCRGGLAGPLGGKLVSSFLDGVLPDIAVNVLVGAYAGGGVGLVEYGLTCGSSKDGCSVGGAFDAALDGAAAGAFFGGLFGGSGEPEPGEPPAVGETPATADAADAAAGDAASAQDLAVAPAEEPAAAPGEEPAAAKEDPAEDESSCPVGSPGEGQAHSFVGGTPVLMADGSTKPISQVEVGDQVSDSVPGDAATQSHPVQAVITTTTDHDFVDVTVKPSKLGQPLAAVALAAAILTTTYHHPFYDITQSAFVEAVDLKPGDQVQTLNGDTATVADVHAYHQQAATYDLTVNGLHTYYVTAGGTPLLVHNCGDDPDAVHLDLTYKDGWTSDQVDEADGKVGSVKRSVLSLVA